MANIHKSTNSFFIQDSVLFEKLRTLTSHQHHKNKRLRCACYREALIEPFIVHKDKYGGGVLTEKNIMVQNSGVHEFINNEAYEYTEDEVAVRDENALYIGCLHSCWGHLFTDGFAKLWYLRTEECKNFINGGGKIVYTTVNNKPLPEYAYKLFEIAGVSLIDFEQIFEITRFKSIYIPDNCFYLQKEPFERMFTDEYLMLIDNIRMKYTNSSEDFPKKIYLSRTKNSKKHRDYGEIEIEKFMQKSGYTIIYPEDHTIDRQISFLANCEAVAATEGSISLNSVFCRPETELLVLKKGAYTNGYQAAVADAAQLSVKYVEANKSIYNNKSEPWAGPFYVLVNKQLRQAVGDIGGKKYYLHHKYWIKYNLYHNPISKFAKGIIRRVINTLK